MSMNRDVAKMAYIGPRYMRELFPRAKNHAKAITKQRRRAAESRIIAEQLNEVDEFKTIDQINAEYDAVRRELEILEAWRTYESEQRCSCCH